jgi:hypothetical protein
LLLLALSAFWHEVSVNTEASADTATSARVGFLSFKIISL